MVPVPTVPTVWPRGGIYILGWIMTPIKRRTGSKPPFRCFFIEAALSKTLHGCQETIHLMTSFLSSRIASSHCLTDWHLQMHLGSTKIAWLDHQPTVNGLRAHRPLHASEVHSASAYTAKTRKHLGIATRTCCVWNFWYLYAKKTAALKASLTWFWFHRRNWHRSRLDRHRRTTPRRNRRKSWDHQSGLRSGSSTEKIVRIWFGIKA